MSVAVVTANSNSYGWRYPTPLDYNLPYTVLFWLYVPSTTLSPECPIWGLSASNGTGWDRIRASGTGTSWRTETTPNGSSWYESYTGLGFVIGWNRVSIRRASLTSLTLRVNEFDDLTNAQNQTGRASNPAGDNECFFTFFASGHADAGLAISNYKSWSAALSPAEIDAEFGNSNFTRFTNAICGCPMSDESVLVNNATSTNGNNWAFGTSNTAWTNPPGVSYGGGPFAMAQVGQTPILGSIHHTANIQYTQNRWRIPTNAAPGTNVWVIVFGGGRSGGYTVSAQSGAVVDALGNVTITGAGPVGSQAFALVHNYADDPAVASIYGGPGIGTSVVS